MQKKTRKHLLSNDAIRAKSEIQERALQLVVKEIYENIGQVLSLVRVDLAQIDFDNASTARSVTNKSSGLLSKVIADLRSMAKQLSMGEVVRKGFADALAVEIDRLNATGFRIILNTKGKPFLLGPSTEFILLNILQHLLISFAEQACDATTEIEITYRSEKIIISITFKTGAAGIANQVEAIAHEEYLVSFARTINATLKHKSHKAEQIILLTIKPK